MNWRLILFGSMSFLRFCDNNHMSRILVFLLKIQGIEMLIQCVNSKTRISTPSITDLKKLIHCILKIFCTVFRLSTVSFSLMFYVFNYILHVEGLVIFLTVYPLWALFLWKAIFFAPLLFFEKKKSKPLIFFALILDP